MNVIPSVKYQNLSLAKGKYIQVNKEELLLYAFSTHQNATPHPAKSKYLYRLATLEDTP